MPAVLSNSLLLSVTSLLTVTTLAFGPAGKSPASRAPKRTVTVARKTTRVTTRPVTKPVAKKLIVPPDWDKETVQVIASGRGRINYEAGIAKATGLGAVTPPSLAKTPAQRLLDARRAAYADAIRNLSLTVNQVRVTADTRVQNYVLKSEDVRLKVDSMVKRAHVIEEKFLPKSGLYRIVVQAPLKGENSLSEAVGLKTSTTPKRVPIPVPTPTPTPAPKIVVEEYVEPEPDPYSPGMPAPENAEYSSLIVDCRGLGVEPSIAPRLYDDNGNELYGTSKVTADYANDPGIVAFPRSPKQAQCSKRAGNNPLTVRACGIQNGNRLWAVIPSHEARRIREANRDSRFFERTAVIFLVDGN